MPLDAEDDDVIIIFVAVTLLLHRGTLIEKCNFIGDWSKIKCLPGDLYVSLVLFWRTIIIYVKPLHVYTISDFPYERVRVHSRVGLIATEIIWNFSKWRSVYHYYHTSLNVHVNMLFHFFL